MLVEQLSLINWLSRGEGWYSSQRTPSQKLPPTSPSSLLKASKSLTESSPMACETPLLARGCALSPHPGSHPQLFFDEAVAYARSRIKHFPAGAQFPFVGIFTVNGRVVNVINKSGQVNNRLRGKIADILRNEGLITPVGITTEGQERRHFGLATKWEVVCDESGD